MQNELNDRQRSAVIPLINYGPIDAIVIKDRIEGTFFVAQLRDMRSGAPYAILFPAKVRS